MLETASKFRFPRGGTPQRNEGRKALEPDRSVGTESPESIRIGGASESGALSRTRIRQGAPARSYLAGAAVAVGILLAAGCAQYDRTHSLSGDVTTGRVYFGSTWTPAAVPGAGRPSFQAEIEAGPAEQLARPESGWSQNAPFRSGGGVSGRAPIAHGTAAAAPGESWESLVSRILEELDARQLPGPDGKGVVR